MFDEEVLLSKYKILASTRVKLSQQLELNKFQGTFPSKSVDIVEEIGAGELCRSITSKIWSSLRLIRPHDLVSIRCTTALLQGCAENFKSATCKACHS